MYTPINRQLTNKRITTSAHLNVILDDFEQTFQHNRRNMCDETTLDINFDGNDTATVRLQSKETTDNRDIVVDVCYIINIANNAAEKDAAPYVVSKQINTETGLYRYRATMRVTHGAYVGEVYDQMERDLRAAIDAANTTRP
jgi:hypothetical protein